MLQRGGCCYGAPVTNATEFWARPVTKLHAGKALCWALWPSVSVFAGDAACALLRAQRAQLHSYLRLNRRPATRVTYHPEQPCVALLLASANRPQEVPHVCRCLQVVTRAHLAIPAGTWAAHSIWLSNVSSPSDVPSHSCPVRSCAPLLSATVHYQCEPVQAYLDIHTHSHIPYRTLTLPPVPCIT